MTRLLERADRRRRRSRPVLELVEGELHRGRSGTSGRRRAPAGSAPSPPCRCRSAGTRGPRRRVASGNLPVTARCAASTNSCASSAHVASFQSLALSCALNASSAVLELVRAPSRRHRRLPLPSRPRTVARRFASSAAAAHRRTATDARRDAAEASICRLHGLLLHFFFGPWRGCLLCRAPRRRPLSAAGAALTRDRGAVRG